MVRAASPIGATTATMKAASETGVPFFRASNKTKTTIPPVNGMTPSPSVPDLLIVPKNAVTVTHGRNDPMMTRPAPVNARIFAVFACVDLPIGLSLRVLSESHGAAQLDRTVWKSEQKLSSL